MPEVGYDNTPVHHDLKTAPPDGFVELRRLPYDEILRRREMATTLSMEQAPQTRKSRPGGMRPKAEQQKIGIEMMQLKTREFEFANCIVDHNLTVDGTPVDFKRPGMAFKIVSPEILQEIELLLSDLNLESDDEELERFTNAASPSSSEEKMQPTNSTLEPVS